MALSPQDRARVARGERPEADAEAQRRRGLDALTDALGRQGGALASAGDAGAGDAGAGDAEEANDARLLREVPPHWG